MDIGKVLVSLRKEHALTQEEFGSIFHVTRQTVSNWENGKNYPDLQTLVAISDRFDISLDTILRGDAKMVETIDRERLASSYRRGRHWISALSGGGVGLLGRVEIHMAAGLLGVHGFHVFQVELIAAGGTVHLAGCAVVDQC